MSHCKEHDAIHSNGTECPFCLQNVIEDLNQKLTAAERKVQEAEGVLRPYRHRVASLERSLQNVLHDVTVQTRVMTALAGKLQFGLNQIQLAAIGNFPASLDPLPIEEDQPQSDYDDLTPKESIINDLINYRDAFLHYFESTQCLNCSRPIPAGMGPCYRCGFDGRSKPSEGSDGNGCWNSTSNFPTDTNQSDGSEV